MTQRIFDVENEKDMADLWNILPDSVNTITKATRIWLSDDGVNFTYFAIKIEWHGKAEIHRPAGEATKEDIGKLCKFWDKKEERESIGILSGFEYDGEFVDDHSWCWSHCRRLTKQEIEELC